jgi:5-methyltetrahydrofolate--homocysteine methyltransferase
MRTSLQDLVAEGGPILADGGMGTTLISLGLERGTPPERWNVDRPEIIRGIHRDYLDAGAKIILTNTFGGSRWRLTHHQLDDRVAELNRASAQLARNEADRIESAIVVGGSMGPTGGMMEPLGDLTPEAAAEMYQEQSAALVDGGVDVLWIETMSDLEEARAALRGCQAAAPGFPIVLTMTFDTHGFTSMGVSPEQALSVLDEFELEAFGGNCGNGPQEIEEVIRKLRAANADVILIAKANAGIPRMIEGRPTYDASPEDMAAHARRANDLGAKIIGACCGSTPEHIRAMHQSLEDAGKVS